MEEQRDALSHRFNSMLEAVTNARGLPAPCASHEANPGFAVTPVAGRDQAAAASTSSLSSVALQYVRDPRVRTDFHFNDILSCRY